jgi:preprotein translocase subunit SecE
MSGLSVENKRTGTMAKQKPQNDKKTKSAAGAELKFWQLYKPGQGYYTRMGTAIGSGVIILAGSHYIYSKLSAYPLLPQEWARYDIVLHVGIPVCFLFGLALVVFRLLNGPRSADFLIAVEGEMKKVNWTSKKEVLGSTRVVIATLLFLGAVLAGIDLLFMTFFRAIGVLQF